MRKKLEKKINELLQRTAKSTNDEIAKLRANLWMIGLEIGWVEKINVNEISTKLMEIEKFLVANGY